MVVRARQDRTGLFGARYSSILADADDTRVFFVGRHSIAFHVLSAIHEASFAVRAALSLWRWSRVLAVDVAVHPGLGNDSRLAYERPAGILWIAPFFGAAVHLALVDAAFADVAALVSLVLLQEIAPPW